MTKKDFELIAAALRASRPGTAGDWAHQNRVIQWRSDVVHMTDTLARHNVRFDKQRFIDACYK